MSTEQTEFNNLLAKLLSDDNDTRSEAEQNYNGINASYRLILLLKTLKDGSVPIMVRSMAAVLLRRLYTSNFEEYWPQVPPDAQANIKEEMLLSVQRDQEDQIRKKTCDALAEFARNMLDDDGVNSWPELLKFLFELASSQNVKWRENSLLILSMVPGVFGAKINEYLTVVRDMLHSCLFDQEHQQIRFVAVRATTSFILAYEKEPKILTYFKELAPRIIQITAESIEQQEDDALLKCLIEVAEFIPKFLRAQLIPTIEMCIKVLSDTDTPDSWRQLALEVIVTMSESAPAMVRKNSKFLVVLVPVILQMMMDLEDDENWSFSDEIDEEDNDSNPIAGESALDRLCCGLGGKVMLSHIVTNVPSMFQQADWKFRYAALMAISTSAEGCHKEMDAMLDGIVDTILPYMKDPHPRVRYAACNAIGQLASDFGVTFQRKYHQKVMTGLLSVLDDHANPRVQAHAGAALVNFSENCSKSLILPYLDPIMNKLEEILNMKFEELLKTGTKLVLEQIVTTLASVADTAEDKFIVYYDRFIPMLKYIIQNAVDDKLKLLRGKTIECISLIGLAVGKDKFKQDCSDVMELLLKTQTDWNDLADDDPQITYMISAWARMCKILGKEFEQFLPLVIGPVIKAASLKPDVAVVDSAEIEKLEKDQEWQFVTLGDQQSFGIKTAGLEEKATACQMLVCYARELKEGFSEYAEQVTQIMVKHLKFYFHDGVRLAAAESFPYLLECAFLKSPEHMVNMWNFVCPELLQALETEPEQELKSEFLYALSQCIERMGKGCLAEKHMKDLVKVIQSTLQEHSARQDERQEQRKDEDYDEIVEEELLDENEEDVYLLSKVADIVHAILGTYKVEALPMFNEMLPSFTKLLEKQRAWADKQWGICIFDDLVEHTGPSSLAYQEYFLQPLLENIVSEQGEVRQAATYGVGVMAQFGGPGYTRACTDALPLLQQVIVDPKSRDLENMSPTENAISAVTKICKYCPGAVNVDEVIPHWLTWLPVWEDVEECVHVYDFLCDLIESNNAHVLGANNANLPRVVGIIGEAFCRGACEDVSVIGIRMINILKQIQTNQELFQACFTQLSPEIQQTLALLLK